MLRTCLVVIGLVLANITFAQNVKSVEGSLINDKTQRPIEGVKIEIQDKESKVISKAKTNAKGTFKFKNIPVGEYDLVVNDNTYNKKTIEFELAKKDVKEGS